MSRVLSSHQQGIFDACISYRRSLFVAYARKFGKSVVAQQIAVAKLQQHKGVNVMYYTQQRAETRKLLVVDTFRTLLTSSSIQSTTSNYETVTLTNGSALHVLKPSGAYVAPSVLNAAAGCLVIMDDLDTTEMIDTYGVCRQLYGPQTQFLIIGTPRDEVAVIQPFLHQITKEGMECAHVSYGL